MIGAALGLELRTLVRSPLRLSVLILILGTGFFVIQQGQRDVARWQEAIEAARAMQEESIEEARALFAAGETGPEDRPWVDLTQPMWQDWYAATRLVREPAPLAGIASASLEGDAIAVRITRFADPMLAQGAEIQNPELEAAGGLDLVTVLALLLPLVILALGVEVGGQERSSRILPLIRVQSGRDVAWLVARCVAVGILGAAVGLLLVIAAVIAGADAAAAQPGAMLGFGLLVLAYAALWTVLLAAVAVASRHASQGAVALGAAWIVLCVLIPSIGVERAASLAADDFGTDLTLEARDAGEEFQGLDDEVVFASLLERFPQLGESLPEERPAISFVEREGLGFIALEARMAEREELGRQQMDLVERMSLASPALAFTHALESLAGRGPQAAQEHRRAVVGAVGNRVERLIAGKWGSVTLDAEDLEELVASTPDRVESTTAFPATELAVLAGWALALAILAAFLSRRFAVGSV